MIINAGIERVVAANDYHESEESKNAFFLTKINTTLISREIKKY
jgi:deoxycytidylate deaminase